MSLTYQALIISRGKIYDELVLDIYSAIRDAVYQAAKSDKIKQKVGHVK
jgi:hypothetical protein